ncbi:amidohydrolase family protein [Klebsiella pneumoniae]|uniref:amidohydrolase family protein n=1 Tax=Klebsiella pneumoniae TaxID=573 RepID=UPI001C6F6E8B|nr:amidohydrolase family protein [Klebsiella pneumoniae]
MDNQPGEIVISRRKILQLVGITLASQQVPLKEMLTSMSSQLNKGRDELVIEPDFPIIDCQHHLFDRPGLRYLHEDYLQDMSAGHNIVASVYIETNAFARADGPEIMRPLGEIEYANGIGAMAESGYFGKRRMCAAIVGHADLQVGSRIGAYLDEALQRAPERFRGIRQTANYHPDPMIQRYIPGSPSKGLMRSDSFLLGVRELAARNLTCDVGVFHQQLSDLAWLADRFPQTLFIINHAAPAVAAGKELSQSSELFNEWRKSIMNIAERPNVLCKICGLGLPFWGFGFNERKDTVHYEELALAWEPYISTVLETFGAGRCMAGSDYPPDGQSAGYVPLWNAIKYSVRHASDDEKHALFYETAQRTYRLSLPATVSIRNQAAQGT